MEKRTQTIKNVIILPATTRKDYIICIAQCKIKSRSPCSKVIKNCKMVTAEHKVLYDHTGHTHTLPTLSV